MKNKPLKLLIFFSIFILVSDCAKTVTNSGDLDIPGLVGDLSEASYALIAIGDDFLSGDQDATLNRFTQQKSVTTLIATQLAQVGNVFYRPPLLEVSGERADSSLLPTNLAIPGATSASLLATSAEAETISRDSEMADRILFPIQSSSERGAATSQVDAALYAYQQIRTQVPTLPVIIIVWVGMNDLLPAITTPNEVTESQIAEAMTALADYQTNLNQILTRLKSNTTATIVIANLFDVTRAAAFLPKIEFEFYFGESVDSSFLTAIDHFNLETFVQGLFDIDQGQDKAILDGLVRDEYSFNSTERALVTTRITEFNDVITTLAAANNIPVVDVFTLMNEAFADDAKVLSTNRLDRRWGRGGFFSLDGLHFSDTLQGYLANAFISVIDQEIAVTIPAVDLATIYASDDYRDSDRDGFVVGPDWSAVDSSTYSFRLHYFIDQDDRDAATIYRRRIVSDEEAPGSPRSF